MAGVYLHIPFCKQACHYCNFHFATSLRYKDEVVKAIAKEIRFQKDYLKGEIVNTVYFGGGTPSLLSIDDCRLLMESLQQTFSIAGNAEITLEANPDDITAEKLESWKSVGVNRLSIGTQSFFEEELQWMNRAHTAAHAKECIELSLEADITNISIDLIYGSPLLTDEMWQQNVQTAIDLGIPHLSCYALTVEEKTPLHKQIAKQQKEPVDEAKSARQFMLLMQWLRQSGYDHYEVSNFAKPGYRSRHNSAYWKGTSYLGLGPSAHSFNGKERSWNIANNRLYVKGIESGRLNQEVEILTAENRLNEHIMISLRTVEGLHLAILESLFGIAQRIRLEKQLQRFIPAGLVLLNNGVAQLTDEGMLRADGIAAALFV